MCLTSFVQLLLVCHATLNLLNKINSDGMIKQDVDVTEYRMDGQLTGDNYKT